MKSRSLRLCLLSGSILFAGHSVMSAASLLDALATESPFMAKDGSTNITNTTGVEFRGVIVTPDGTYFGLYDRVNNKASWVKQGDKADQNKFEVVSFDTANGVEQAKIKYDSHPMTLALATANVLKIQSPQNPQQMPNANNGLNPGAMQALQQLGQLLAGQRGGGGGGGFGGGGSSGSW